MTRSVCNFIWYRMHLHWSHLKNLMLEFYKTIVLWLKLLFHIKGTLFVFIWKQYSENFIFLILRILKLFNLEVCKCLKKYANFYRILFCVYFSHISRAHISKRERCFNAKSLTYYFHVKTKVLADFEICIKL